MAAAVTKKGSKPATGTGKALKTVFFFGNGKAEGITTAPTDKERRLILGGKGAGLADMTSVNLPVPPGFTISIINCEDYYKAGRKLTQALKAQVYENMAKVEKAMGKKFGDLNDPLLFSVRSGAARSMPGMMETILNLGLNDASVEGLAKKTNNPRFAYDAYRRFIQMYSTTAMDLPKGPMEDLLHALKAKLGVKNDPDISAEGLKELCGQFKKFYAENKGEPFPQDPYEQLWGSIGAVFNSWEADKAITYRRVEKIADLKGTAVNVQTMVYGNMGETSGTGVCFTRDPNTGENIFYGDCLVNAQGEDVVAGIRTPMKLIELNKYMPKAYKELCQVRLLLEKQYKDMQDLEFTVQEGKLYMLQCRTGKRTPVAIFQMAVDMVKEKLITKEEAIARINPEDIERLFYPQLDSATAKTATKIATGINAVPGAASGKVVFTAHEAEAMAANGDKVLLVRKETSPEDVGGMHAAQGILTATGGKTSHAAVVARGWGKCCIVGCEAVDINYEAKTMRIGGLTIKQGEYLTLDGNTGDVYVGELPLKQPAQPAAFFTLMKWCDEFRRLKVRANADTPYDAANGIKMGAQGIGLCRTEHMFFDTEDRRLAMQEMIVAGTLEARKAALAKLLPYQQADFEGIFTAMNDKPVTIRLIDPPLHEFTPKDDEGVAKLSQVTGISPEAIKHRCEQLHESNPMLGHRGCRLCITYPEILEMQVTAIINAAISCSRKGIKVLPEIMIPLTIDKKELKIQVDQARAIADGLIKAAKAKVKYMIGTMIEIPRAALLADQIAEVAEFFSCGTNDLTQMTLGLSRDDAGRFLPTYVANEKDGGAGIFKVDPFQSLDQEGVGMLVKMAIDKGRSTKPNLKVGICGEHGGESASVKFCHKIGMDYVSCSPYRVPIARLAAAQASISDKIAAAAARKPAPKIPPKVAAYAAPKKIVKAQASKPKAPAKAALKPVKKVAKKATKPVAKKVTKPVAKKAPAKKVINKKK